ncbi:tRNA (uracil-5-)-methyltransferase-like A [Silurus meridionalis]|nr:tRNA (uracil-5-)-methyltransferase-like A [Silurus meridionalis]
MADVPPESSVLNEEPCIKPEPPQESKLLEDPTAERSKDEGGEGEESSSSDVYRYIKEDLFTSEIFKVEIQNLPKYIGFNDLKKFLNKHRLNPHKIKLMGKQMFAFVTFKNQEDRDKAMKVVHGVQWKGKVLSVRLAKPKADPLLRKRRQDGDAGDGQPTPKRLAEGHEDAEDQPLSVRIANVVTPLWQVPYQEQLRRKEQEVESVLHVLTRFFFLLHAFASLPASLQILCRLSIYSKVILAIRRAEHLKRLVYVACNAKAAMNNFVDLCRAPSNRVRGAPFRPVRAMAVDLFPQTMHCETILLFERVDYGSGAEHVENSGLKPTP